VAGEDPGAMLEKAEKLGMKIIDEVEFMEILRMDNFDLTSRKSLKLSMAE
jgi:BRCT domain type II-containing protein